MSNDMTMSLWIELEREIGILLYMTTLNLKHTIFLRLSRGSIHVLTPPPQILTTINSLCTLILGTSLLLLTYTGPHSLHHSEPLSLIEYMSIMGARCTKQDSGLKASTTFRNVHCNRRWVQRNNLGVNHTTLFNMPVLQIIYSLMTRQYTVCTVCLNTVILYSLITNSQRIKGAKYSHPILVTRLCRNFLPDEVFSAYNRVFVAPECIKSAYNNCLHAVWTPSVQPEDRVLF